MEPSWDEETALQSFYWGEATDKKRAWMYAHYPERRNLYLRLPSDKLAMLEHLEDSLAVGIIRKNYNFLSCCSSQRVPLVTRLLSLVTNKDEAMEAFEALHQETRAEVVCRLKPDSRDRLDAVLTESMVRRIKEGLEKTKEFTLISTKALLDQLDEHLRTCASSACIGKSQVPFKEYTPFEMHPEKNRCFHLACSKETYR